MINPSTSLFDAIEGHDLPRLASLLEGGADPNVAHPDGPEWVPLKGAVEEMATGGPAEAVVLLLRHGAAVDGGRVPSGTTPLIVAAVNCQAEAIRLLLAAGADPNARDNEGDTPLAVCVCRGERRSAELLRLSGAV